MLPMTVVLAVGTKSWPGRVRALAPAWRYGLDQGGAIA